MDNFELMKILQQLNRSNRNKNLAWGFGSFAAVGIIVAYFLYKKNKSTYNENIQLSGQNHSLKLKVDSLLGTIQQMNQKFYSQSILIKNYSDRISSLENKEEKKG
jgi:hypothetical protein